MGKRTPSERWAAHIRERYIAFKLSPEFKRLRRHGLSAIGRKKLLSAGEWWQSSPDWPRSDEYLKWHDECKQVGEKFGLASWTVEMACLLRGYNLEAQPHVMEARWPMVRIVTEGDDPLFLQWLCYHAWTLGLHVIHRSGSLNTVLLRIPFPECPQEELTDARRPPKDKAIYVRVEYPAGFPSEARQQYDKEVSELERELLKRLGYPAPRRLRASKMASQAKKLKVWKKPLNRRGLYEIVAKTYPLDTADKDQVRTRTVKSRRYRLSKRLIEPFVKDA
jgi:hypothetical protein